MQTSAITPQILEFLLTPSAYPVQTGSVELIQTHVSWLLLTDSHVFKLKKPVNFGFLDFSTLDLRKFYCHEELRLNRRLCPDIYEQVIALRKTDSGASFVGSGEIIDYAVMMKRLPAVRMLDRLIDRGAVSIEEIQVVARQISLFHEKAATSAHISEFGSIEQIQFNWNENFEQTAQFKRSTLPQKVKETIKSYVDAFIDLNKNLFTQRVESGFIRECDGDIHLGNICLVNGSAYIFDCIEFNERFRFSDTAADIAFLLMDLDFHNRPDLADAALNAYITASGDKAISELITFYKVYRAFVRGKVESMQLLDAGISEELRTVAASRADRYFRLAQGYCLQSRLPPTLFITCGTMGCGKSTLADQLSFELGLKVFNSDIVRKQLAGLSPATSVRDSFGEGLYNTERNHETYRQLVLLAQHELESRRSVIIDASFSKAVERARFENLASTHKADFIILFVQCDPKEQNNRLKERSNKQSVSDGRIELLEQQRQVFEPPDESDDNVVLCRSCEATGQQLQLVYERLKQP